MAVGRAVQEDGEEDVLRKTQETETVSDGVYQD